MSKSFTDWSIYPYKVREMLETVFSGGNSGGKCPIYHFESKWVPHMVKKGVFWGSWTPPRGPPKRGSWGAKKGVPGGPPGGGPGGSQTFAGYFVH